MTTNHKPAHGYRFSLSRGQELAFQGKITYCHHCGCNVKAWCACAKDCQLHPPHTDNDGKRHVTG